MQRRTLIATTGCYRRTPLADLLNLVGAIDIVKKLDIDITKSKEERRAEHSRLLSEQGYDEEYSVLEDLDSKELLWFYTGQGQFRSYLGAVNLAPSFECRFRGAELESPAHLMYDCRNFEHLDADHSDLNSLSLKARQVCIEIYKLER